MLVCGNEGETHRFEDGDGRWGGGTGGWDDIPIGKQPAILFAACITGCARRHEYIQPYDLDTGFPFGFLSLFFKALMNTFAVIPFQSLPIPSPPHAIGCRILQEKSVSTYFD